jgi:hypothetical protein
MKLAVQFLLATAGVAAYFCAIVWVIMTYGVAGVIFVLGVLPLISLAVFMPIAVVVGIVLSRRQRGAAA